MRMSRRTTRHLICLTSLLAFASTPLLAQTGIDLLDPEQVLRAGESNGTATVRATLAEVPTGVSQATHQTDDLRYDDNGFENFEDDSTLRPTTNLVGTGMVEWAQRFRVPADSTVVSAFVCFYRPENDPSRSLDFKLRFYSDQLDGSVRNPGRRSALTYIVDDSDIRRPGTHSCVRLRGHLVGKTLTRGMHWVGVEWDTRTRKRLGGDHYTSTDQADVDRSGIPEHATEVRYRNLPVSENAVNEGWQDGRTNSQSRSSGLKAIGIRLVVERTHAPDPTPDPGPGPGPAPDSACSDGLCLLDDDRFRVRVRYRMAGMSAESAGTVAAGLAGAAGLFTFGDDTPALLVRVVDDCSGSGYFGLYAGAASDADYSIAVRDTTTDQLKWFSARGGASTRDAMAFACNN